MTDTPGTAPLATPLSVKDYPEYSGDYAVIEDDNGKPLACYMNLATATAIVEAVNSAGRMREALEAMLDDHYKAHLYEAWCDADKPNGHSAWKEVEAIEEQALAALKSTEPEPRGVNCAKRL